jgi:hypothetical protein
MKPPPPLHENPTDRDHLNLLAIFHYVIAGTALLGLLFLIGHYVLMATLMNPALQMPVSGSGSRPPPDGLTHLIGGFYAIAGLAVIAMGVANFLSGRWIHQRQNRMFSLVIAGINCLHVPLGLTLGIFTFIVLMRPSVQHAYQFAPDPS